MPALTKIFTSPLLPALIILLTVFEAAALTLYHHRTGRGVTPTQFLPNLLAGDCLLLALAIALARGPWQCLAFALLASLLCHATDLSRRWRS